MKTNRFWYFMAVAAVFAGMTTLVSCDKEEPFEQEIIESEVLEEGVAEEVTEETGTEGTTLSYESWIVVKGQTRAAFENKVSVTLFNRFNHVIDEVEVDGFEFGEPTVDISFREAESRAGGLFQRIYPLRYKHVHGQGMGRRDGARVVVQSRRAKHRRLGAVREIGGSKGRHSHLQTSRRILSVADGYDGLLGALVAVQRRERRRRRGSRG